MTDQAGPQRPLDVLLVEDSATQALLTESVVEDMPELHLVATVKDGETALAYLKRNGEYESAPRPDLVLLDINMPGKGGFDVLQEMKADDQLRLIPVVMLTSSESEGDVAQSYADGANSFIVKPVSPQGLEQMLQRLAEYWRDTARLPREK